MHTPARIHLPPTEPESAPMPPPESSWFDDLCFFGPLALGALFFAYLVLGSIASTLKDLGWIP